MSWIWQKTASDAEVPILGFGGIWITPLFIFTNPSARGGYDKINFKRSLTGSNSEFKEIALLFFVLRERKIEKLGWCYLPKLMRLVIFLKVRFSQERLPWLERLLLFSCLPCVHQIFSHFERFKWYFNTEFSCKKHFWLTHLSQIILGDGIMAKAMDCGIVVREFVLQSRYYVHFQTNTLGKGMHPLNLQPMG